MLLLFLWQSYIIIFTSVLLTTKKKVRRCLQKQTAADFLKFRYNRFYPKLSYMMLSGSTPSESR